ncbi:sigma-E processing peptidase SpoIIGA [Paraliobacillus ryukyuensis]|uniref:sigma-E processing peptidase SpoIIGA n=1 Tax=Paraliobacillus ryukyuensis TaxID=200904 RepID=UPI00211732CB|nr:sigma-E processing peptidase SpoIIGA [Paraliobacillus ryukyuensis]
MYLDAVWLLNILLDWMILLLTRHMAKISARNSMIFFGACAASLLVPLTVFYPESILLHPIGKLLLSMGIVLIGFGLQRPIKLLRLLAIFYFITFTLGGALTAIHFFLSNPMNVSKTGIVTWSSGYGDPISWSFVILGFPVVWWFTKQRLDKHTLLQFQTEQLMQVIIQLDNQIVQTTGYVDSGNQLIDPFSRKTVVVCDFTVIKQLFSEETIQLMKKVKEDNSFEQLYDKIHLPVNLVPYQDVSGQSQFMLVFRPDKFTIFNNQTRIDASNVLIGLQFGQLTQDEIYHCLLHPALFNQTSKQIS